MLNSLLPVNNTEIHIHHIRQTAIKIRNVVLNLLPFKTMFPPGERQIKNESLTNDHMKTKVQSLLTINVKPFQNLKKK